MALELQKCIDFYSTILINLQLWISFFFKKWSKKHFIVWFYTITGSLLTFKTLFLNAAFTIFVGVSEVVRYHDLCFLLDKMVTLNRLAVTKWYISSWFLFFLQCRQLDAYIDASFSNHTVWKCTTFSMLAIFKACWAAGTICTEWIKWTKVTLFWPVRRRCLRTRR